MRIAAIAALAVSTGVLSARPSAAQTLVPVQPITGTRVDISATGEVNRVPDIAVISAGVVNRAQTASAAIQQNSERMNRVRAALRRAGIEDRDIQTSSLNLNPDYRYQENQPPVLTGYQASNTLSIRFRDIRNTGKILDALVAEGANQISGPNLMIDKPDEALDEARMKAVALGQARAQIYARALGKRVVRLISVSESGSHGIQPPMPYAVAMESRQATNRIEPGEQKVEVTLSMSFELQ